MACKDKFMQWNNLVSVALLSISTFSLLMVGCLSFSGIPAGEMSGQWMWLGRAGILFMIGALFAKLFFSGNNLGMVFYCIIKWELILLGGIEAVWGICHIGGHFFKSLFILYYGYFL